MDEDIKKGLMFTIGGERYIMDIDVVEGVIENKRPTPIPGAPSYIPGIMNVRGALMPLVDFRKLIGADGGRKFRIILANIEGKKIGIMVDDVNDIVDYRVDEVSALPLDLNNDMDIFAGVLRYEGETVILVRSEGLLHAMEVES